MMAAGLAAQRLGAESPLHFGVAAAEYRPVPVSAVAGRFTFV